MSDFSHSLMLPTHCVTSLALFWCSDNPHLILQDEIVEWLERHDMAYKITYDDPSDESDECEACDHFIAFQNHYDAIAFKLRWF